MFRLGKRNFSLKDSPSKLSSLGSVSSLTRLQASSPAKKVKLSDNIQLMSSTLLQETRLGDHKDRLNLEIDVTKNSNLDLSVTDLSHNLVDFAEGTSFQAPATTSIPTTVETPPPTPDVESQLDILRNAKEKLYAENKELKNKLEELSSKVIDLRTATLEFKSSRLAMDNLHEIVSKGHNDIRDQLNQIYNPGQELAQLVGSLVKELRAKQERKFEKKSLELNCRIDQTLSAIRSRKETYIHEIELHMRTLVHQKSEILADQESENNISEVQAEHSVSENQGTNETTEAEKNDEDGDNEDCVILDECDATSNRNDDDAMSNELSKSTENIQVTCDDDDEQTDVEENSTEASRPFTPCQAQRQNV